MRVIAGRCKGLRLIAPRGRATRPTADRVKEALFSMLASLPFDLAGASVVDFFAGSGALGLEALSRGARRAVLADRSPEAMAALRRNAEACRLAGSAPAIQTTWPRGWEKLAPWGPFHLLLLDPPYDEAELPLGLLRQAAARGLAAPGAVAVWEQSPATLAALPRADLGPWQTVKTRLFGHQAAAFLRLAPGQAPTAETTL